MCKKPKSIDDNGTPIDDNELLLRLLCSPQYYDEETGIVNVDAFDLRKLSKGGLEDYVSVNIKQKLVEENKFEDFCKKGFKLNWPEHDPQNVYYGVGEFLCKKAREVHSMVEINPLKGPDKSHVGLFYKKSDVEYYKGPLPKDNPEILELLNDLALLVHILKV